MTEVIRNAEGTSRPVCVVTGGTEGIGRAIALRFARNGHDIVICARRPEALEATRAAIEASKVECLALGLDLSAPQAGGALVHAAHDRFGRVDVLVNNAGYAVQAPIQELGDEDFRVTLAVNVEAVFRTTRAVWPVMRAQGRGTIVNISSLASVDPFPGLNVYGAAKAWVNLFTKAAGDEGRPHGIGVFALACGAVETRMLRALFPDIPTDQTLDPDTVADFAASLCMPAMIHASGQTFLFRK